MGTLGKILLFVNLLAAAAVVYLAAQDWSKRQDVSAMAERHSLMLTGLPVEAPKDVSASKSEVALGAEGPGMHRVETVRPSFLEAHFRGSEGGQSPFKSSGAAPANQVEEVRRVQTAVNSQLSAANTPAAKLALLCGQYSQQGAFAPGWLSMMAESYDERQLFRSMVTQVALADAQRTERNAADAEAMLKKRFDAVLAAPNPSSAGQEAEELKRVTANLRAAADEARKAGQQFWQAYKNLQAALALQPGDPQLTAAQQAFNTAAKSQQAAQGAMAKAQAEHRQFLTNAGTAAARDESDRRRRIAHLLMHLDRDAAWQKRVSLVVGLRTYLTAVQQQTDRLREMAVAAQQEITLDQAEFTEAYQTLESLANEQALLVDRQRGLTADLAAQLSADRTAVTGRKAQLDRRLQDFAALQQQVAEALARQEQTEAALFAAERQVGDTLQRNADLEEKLKAAEEKKAGGASAEK